jgi:hypothetical protein
MMNITHLHKTFCYGDAVEATFNYIDNFRLLNLTGHIFTTP